MPTIDPAGAPQSEGVPQPVPADEYIFLIGRPPVGEFLGFLETETIEGRAGNRAALMQQWRIANDHIRKLERDQAGWADNAPVQSLPEELVPLGDQVLNDPVTIGSFNVVPVEIGIVELDRMVVWQKQMNTAYVRRLREALGSDPSNEDLFRFSLPYDRRYDPAVRSAQVAQNGWTFISSSSDFRPLDIRMIDPASIHDLEVSGAPVAVVGVVVGYGSNYLSAIRCDGRLVLNNGSHRAYALREAGHTHVPCLIQQVSRRDELEVIASGDLGQDPERYLEAPRPPVLRDYFDPHLRMTVHRPRKDTEVRVAVNVEKTQVPGI